MGPGVYRNTGAPWRRVDGKIVARDEEFEPTSEERARRSYKLRYVRPSAGGGEPVLSVAAPAPVAPNIEEFAVAPGRYMVHGEEVEGREAAMERLRGADE